MKTTSFTFLRSLLAVTLCAAVTLGSAVRDAGAVRAEDARWVRGVNDWGFSNAGKYMTADYSLNEQDKAVFYQGLKNTERFAIDKTLKEPWTGGCYGFSATSVLSCYGLVPYEQYAVNASAVPQCLNDVGFPYIGGTANSMDVTVPKEVKSLLNAYQLLQLKDSHRQVSARQMYRYTEQERVEMLTGLMEQGTPALISILFPGEDPKQGRFGHALVAYGIEDCEKEWEYKKYNKKILLADPNAPYKTVNPEAVPALDMHDCMYVNTKDGSWVIPFYGKSDDGANLTEILSDPNAINQGGTLPGTADPETQEPFIGVMTTNWLEGDYRLQKAVRNGNTVTAQGTADFRTFDAFYPDNVESAVKNYLTEDIDDAYVMELDETQSVELLMYYENSIQRVQSRQMAEASVAPSGYAGFKGGKDAYSLEIVTNEDYPTPWYDVTVNGEAGSASLSMQENGYLLTADRAGILEVVAKNDTQTLDKCYAADADAVLLYESGGELAAAVDRDGNGTYETVLAEYFMLGDANLDGTVNAKDAAEVLRMAARIGTGQTGNLTEVRQASADANQNGSVNAVDAALILQYAAVIGTGKASGTLEDYAKSRK